MYVCACSLQHMHAYTHRSQRKVSNSLELELQVVVSLLPNVGPFEVQKVLLTTAPSLQAYIFLFLA